MAQTFGFDEAVRLLKAGKRVARDSWRGAGFIERTEPNPIGISLTIVTSKGPSAWPPAHDDLWAEDWIEVDG